jgi:hypothetical protein
MSEPEYVKVTNNCPEKITVYLRYPRPRKGSLKGPGWFTLISSQSSHPLPLHFLVGAKGWESLKNRACVHIESVSFEPRFVRIANLSGATIELAVVPTAKVAKKRKTTLTIRPGRESRTVDIQSVTQRQRLNNFVKRGQVTVAPVYDIGPSTGRSHAVGSYAAEDVYICYKCGGPIVFRGFPPTPVHI